MFAGKEGQSSDGITMDVTEAWYLTSANSFVQMLQDREDLFMGQLGLVKRGSLMFGKPSLTGLAA